MSGRFKEIISVQKIVDTDTNKQYNGMIDTELLDLINNIAAEEILLQKRVELMEEFCTIHAAFLKKEGYTIKDIFNYINEQQSE